MRAVAEIGRGNAPRPTCVAVVEAISVPSSNTRTVAPASAVPLSATLCAFVAVATAAPSVLLTAATGEATGAAVSTATLRAVDAALCAPLHP
jgi:hypothetical protein